MYKTIVITITAAIAFLAIHGLGSQVDTTRRLHETTAACQGAIEHHTYSTCYRVEVANNTEYICGAASCWSEAR